jgi:hypothetical protein
VKRATLGASILAVMVGGRFFGHYFHQVTAPLAVLAAPAAASFSPRRLAAGLAIPAGAFLAAGALHSPIMNIAGQPDPDVRAVTAFIDAHAKDGDSICLWGNTPELYFVADRPLGCRFVFSNYLTGLSPATATQTDPDVDASANIVPEAWDMLEADVATRRPRWFVDASPGDVGHYGKFAPAHFPRLAAILERDYVPVATIAGMRVLERREDGVLASLP